jgi:4-hydroxy-tetrahydrodipicolinate reductase
MLTIGLVGMGKMGQTIAAMLETRSDLRHYTFQRITSTNEAQLQACDVVIEFTVPEAAPEVIRRCLELNKKVVSGTTGWHEYHLSSIISYCREQHGTLLYATNFSIGMNIVFGLNRRLATLMNQFPQFHPSIKETHHIQKLDKPSGTAYTLVGDILDVNRNYSAFELLENDAAKRPEGDTIPVTSIREGDIKGIHEVTWASPYEKLTISHEAFDRRIFAEGALMAANWLAAKPQGVYTMQDILSM